jgi:hypothetical protein
MPGIENPKLKPKDARWDEVRKRYRLSHEHVRMAKALGMNPKKLGKLANHKQEPWKAPLPVFIEECYRKRFRKEES